jgi:hypothetical protein
MAQQQQQTTIQVQVKVTDPNAIDPFTGFPRSQPPLKDVHDNLNAMTSAQRNLGFHETRKLIYYSFSGMFLIAGLVCFLLSLIGGCTWSLVGATGAPLFVIGLALSPPLFKKLRPKKYFVHSLVGVFIFGAACLAIFWGPNWC